MFQTTVEKQQVEEQVGNCWGMFQAIFCLQFEGKTRIKLLNNSKQTFNQSDDLQRSKHNSTNEMNCLIYDSTKLVKLSTA
jgi:hypothetical protein